ncbi:hypothetical protein MRX96_023755 [Rhipicephalus microplus]
MLVPLLHWCSWNCPGLGFVLFRATLAIRVSAVPRVSVTAAVSSAQSFSQAAESVFARLSMVGLRAFWAASFGSAHREKYGSVDVGIGAVTDRLTFA